MPTIKQLFEQGRKREVWDLCCGFLDLSLDEFMDMQQKLLMEQIELMSDCELGRKLMGNQRPTTVEEFRRVVPLTTYDNYAPYLLEKREDVLPIKEDILWARTSGRSGEYPCKWVPNPLAAVKDKTVISLFLPFILGTCSRKGEVAIDNHDKLLNLLAPPPYISGIAVQLTLEGAPFDLLTPDAVNMSFAERLEAGMKRGLKEGIDACWGLSSVLAKTGELLGQKVSEGGRGEGMPHPKALWRIGKAMAKSKLAGRPLYPKDLWKVKAIVTSGAETPIYREAMVKYWGKQPLECYYGAEIGVAAMQTWDFEGMTFLPDMNFLEFIPEEENTKAKADPNYQPGTVLLNEVEAGKNYELVITNFLARPFMRYRPGDMIRITALRNEKLDIDIPQMVFHSRCDEIIDMAGFTRLTEKVVWQAIADTGIAYEDWVIRKEIKEKTPILHLYIEIKDETISPEVVEQEVHEGLKRLDSDYKDMEQMLGLKPLQATILPPGTFQRYIETRIAEGSDLGHMKAVHIQPSDKIMNELLNVTT